MSMIWAPLRARPKASAAAYTYEVVLTLAFGSLLQEMLEAELGVAEKPLVDTTDSAAHLAGFLLSFRNLRCSPLVLLGKIPSARISAAIFLHSSLCSKAPCLKASGASPIMRQASLFSRNGRRIC